MALLNLLDPLNLLGSILNPPAPAPAPAPVPAPTPVPAPAVNYPTAVIEDFENIAGAVNDWNYVGLPKGWYTDNPSGIIEVGSQKAYGLVGVDTNKIVEIEAATGDFNLYTMVQTTAGKEVTITFDAAQRPGYTSKIAVLVNGKEIGLIYPQTQTLEPFAFTAQGTGQPMRVEFKSTDSNAFGVLMDNIKVLQPLQNNEPIAADDTASGKQNADVVIASSTLLANDKDADGDALSIFSVQDAVNGTVKMEGDKVIFTPNAGYSGPASFTYTAFDGKDGTSIATVNLAIESSIVDFNNSAIFDFAKPPAGWFTDNPGGFIEVNTGTNYGVPNATSNVIELERNVGDASNLYTLVNSTVGQDVVLDFDFSARGSARVGELNTNAINILVNGKVINTVDSNVAGFNHYTLKIPGTGEQMRIEFKAVDSNAVGGLLDNIDITSQPSTGNQAPIANDDAVSGFKNNEFVISPSTLLGNDVDPEGGAINGVGLGNAVNGNVYWDGTNVIFTPTAGYAGPASFTYTIADDKGVESTATVNLTIANNASAANVTNGTAAADSLIDTSGDDVMSGLAGNDKMVATDGNDTLSGGAGNDLMQGGAGADTFTWTLADTSAAGIEIDTLYADGNDKLNMKDLLIGEANTANALDNYLHFSFENGDTVVSVSTKGTFADNNTTGAINNGTVDQKIVLSGFDLTAGNTMSDVQVIQNLLNGNHLITD